MLDAPLAGSPVSAGSTATPSEPSPGGVGQSVSPFPCYCCCTTCASHWGPACSECGGVAFHKDGCGEIEDADEAEGLHILSIEPDYCDTYGHSYRVAYSLDGATVRVTEFARQGRHDDWSVVGGQELAESHFAFGELAEIITEEVEGRDVATVAAENLTRAREWLAFREGATEPTTIKIPVLSLREVADEWLREQSMRQGGV